MSLCGISSISACDIAAITSSSALLLAKGCTVDDLNTLGNLVSAVGSMILTFATSNCIPTKDDMRDFPPVGREFVETIDNSVNSTLSQQQSNSQRYDTGLH
jgi:hypothetical protein